MDDTKFNYVGTHRKSSLFSQREVAFLLGVRSRTTVSHIELGRRFPKLETALALQFLFRRAPHEMFPGFYTAVEDRLMRRAKDLLDTLGAKTDPTSEAKRAFLERLPRIDRLITTDA